MTPDEALQLIISMLEDYESEIDDSLCDLNSKYVLEARNAFIHGVATVVKEVVEKSND